MTTPQHLSDRYELGEILGFGGMSEVHLARDVRLHRDVAVKVLRADLARDPSFYLRFRREAQNAAALNHPAIVAVYDTGEAETATGPLPYIVMEYVDGVTLRDIVHNDGPIAPRRAIEIIADACQALNFSHQHGIIHRDVKPANIMMSKTGAVKVMDFGIARALHDGGVSVTQTAAVIGTAQYLSPEQARGETVDARSDVYSLGCVLYEVLTGEPPFVGDSPVAVAYQHVREDPVPPSERNPDLSPDLDAVVLKALAKNPENRYQTAADMRTDLIRVHSGEAPEAPKVFTDAERTSLLSSGPYNARPAGRNQPPMHIPGNTDQFPAHQRTHVPRERKPAIGKWFAVVAVLVVLTVVVTVLLNFVGGNPRDVQIPDVTDQAYDEAVVSLQNLGFKTIRNGQDSSDVPVDHVISTDPPANTAAARDDQITINVSTGPKQAEVPDVSKLIPGEAERKLKAAGFENIRETPGVSSPEDKGRVTGTVPPANSTSAITNQITIVVGSGPNTKQIPQVEGQTIDVATQVLVANGFTAPPIPVEVDGLGSTKGQVMGTIPAAGETVPVDTPIQVQVSRGNQFVMPDLRGQFWVDAEPLLRSMGWTGDLNKLSNAQNSGYPTNAVATQSPTSGTPIKVGDPITLSFAQ
ncbi:MAG: Stk1 family PASTA domain-containing Ser/Thr kinase [Mycobacterium sp.]